MWFAEALFAKIPVVLRRLITKDWQGRSDPWVADLTKRGIRGTKDRTQTISIPKFLWKLDLDSSPINLEISLMISINCLPASTFNSPLSMVSKWLGIFKFFELSNFLFYGALDFIRICVNTFRAQQSTFLFYFTRISSFRLVYRTFKRLSRKVVSLRRVVAPFSSDTILIYLLQRVSLQPIFSFFGEISLLF